MSPDSKNQWWIFSAVISSVILIYIDQTILPVALPAIQRDFNTTTPVLQWMVISYLLAMAAFILPGGWLSDHFGHRKIFILGLAVFGFASLLGAFSPNSSTLITARALQGLGAALSTPSRKSLIVAAFPQNKRGLALGLTTSGGAVFLAIGPLLGGLFTEYLSWRWIFGASVPIVALGLILSIKKVPVITIEKTKPDLLGFFAYCFGFLFFALAFWQIRILGWTHVRVWLFLAISISCFYFVALHERAVKNRFLDIFLFKNKKFLISSINMFFAFFIFMLTVFWVIYFQNVIKLTPSQAGVLIFLATSPTAILAPVAGKLWDRFGISFPVRLGYLLIIFSLFWIYFFSDRNHPLILIPAFFALGSALPLLIIPSNATAATEVHHTKRGQALGLLDTLRASGSAFGTAIIGAILHRFDHHFLNGLLKKIPNTQNLTPPMLDGLLAKSPVPLALVEQLPPKVETSIISAAVQSATEAFKDTHLLLGAVFCLLFVLVCFLTYHKHHKEKL